MRARNSAGFTLIELLIVIAVIGILAAIILVAVDPVKRLAQANNARRSGEVYSILNAILNYSVDYKGYPPSGIDGTWRMLGTDGSGCDVECGATGTSSLSLTDSTQANFNQGTYSNTVFDTGTSRVKLTGAGITAGYGYYTSALKDTGLLSSWQTLSWTRNSPAGSQLPDSGASESGFATGNANMSGNRLLLHLNESASSSSFADTSGSSNNGSCGGGACPTSGAAGKFGGAVLFNGSSQYVSFGDVLDDVFSGSGKQFTVSTWVKPAGAMTNNVILAKYENLACGADQQEFIFKLGAGNRPYFTWYGDLNGSSRVAAIGSTAVNDTSRWYHLAVTYDGSASASDRVAFFVNGYADATSVDSSSGTPAFIQNGLAHLGLAEDLDGSGAACNDIGKFNGNMDEVAVWNRILSSTEIRDLYRRGGLSLKFQLKACSTSTCTGASFMGPDGTGATYYSAAYNSTSSTITASITNLPNNVLIQYKAGPETGDSTAGPEFGNVTIAYGGSGGMTAPACLDLSGDLVDQYIAQIPTDPKVSTSGKSYYAVKKSGGNRVWVLSCAPQLGEVIGVER